MKLETIVPSRSVCEKIGHLFPESLLVWTMLKNGEWDILPRGRWVLKSQLGSFPAPTISEMMRRSNSYFNINKSQTDNTYYPVHYEGSIGDIHIKELRDFRRPEHAWAALIHWQEKEGCLP